MVRMEELVRMEDGTDGLITSQFLLTTVVFPQPNRLAIKLDTHNSYLEDIEIYLGLINEELANYRKRSRGREVCLQKWYGWKSTTREGGPP